MGYHNLQLILFLDSAIVMIRIRAVHCQKMSSFGVYHISGMYFLQPIATHTSKFSLFLEFYHCGVSLVYLGVLGRARVNLIKESFLSTL
jgi:hypothetical protein